jgi:hypothetical protein
MAKRHLNIGDLIEIETNDHTSDDSKEGWRKPDEIDDEGPSELFVSGYYVGEDEKAYKLAMAKCGDKFTTFWYVPKNKHLKLYLRRRKK